MVAKYDEKENDEILITYKILHFFSDFVRFNNFTALEPNYLPLMKGGDPSFLPKQLCRFFLYPIVFICKVFIDLCSDLLQDSTSHLKF